MLTNFFTHLFGTLATTLMLAALGGGTGVASAMVGRLFRGAYAYAIAAAVGAVLLVGTYGTGWLGAKMDAKAQAEIALLKAENEKLAADLSALHDVRDYEQQQAQHQAQQLAQSEALYSKVVASIEKHKDDPGCTVDEEIMQSIEEMK